MARRTVLGGCAAVANCLASPLSAAVAAGLPTPLQRAAVPALRASSAVLLALAHAGNRLVACGERGIVIVSDDGGNTWRQAWVPVSVTLTAVTFHDARLGWAVGHAGVLLQTRDGGLSWQLQSASTADKPGDRTLLDVMFDDELHGVAVGAFGLVLRTANGGLTWEQVSTRASSPTGLHLYAVRRVGSMLYLVGEQGFFARLSDGGSALETIPTPYSGTFFCLAAAGDSVFLGGLRGTVLRWQAPRFDTIELPSKASVLSMQRHGDNSVLAVNQAGDLLQLAPHAAAMSTVATAGMPLAAALEVAPRSFVGVGFFGATRFSVADPHRARPAGVRS